ncbi:MAG: gamma-glutamylcyclotransferase [Pseudomonadota bacterium]
MPGLSESCWVFAYGSLIFRVDFPYLERAPAAVDGWQRRFWQGSHDHRGTPDAPGRVLTLVPSPGVRCGGMAYRVAPDVLTDLDYREKNGYERTPLTMELAGRGPVVGLSYIAHAGNPAFLGPASDAKIAQQIADSCGPSGRNVDYVLDLARVLRELGEHDAHVFGLEQRLRPAPGMERSRS